MEGTIGKRNPSRIQAPSNQAAFADFAAYDLGDDTQ